MHTLEDGSVSHSLVPPAGRGAIGVWVAAILTDVRLVDLAGQLLLTHLCGANGIEITATIWFRDGHLPKLRTVRSATLLSVILGMGVTLGLEGAPQQAGAVVANVMSNRGRRTDERHRLFVAYGGGAGMAVAYNIPLGGALFALDILHGALAWRFILPAGRAIRPLGALCRFCRFSKSA